MLCQLKARASRLALVWIPWFVMLGCERETVIEGTPTTPPVEHAPDRIDGHGRLAARYYGSTNPYTAARLEELIDHNSVAIAVSWFERDGFRIARDASFVIEGNSEGQDVSATFILMHPPPHRPDEGAVLACIKTGERLEVHPAVVGMLSFNAPGQIENVKDRFYVNPVPMGSMSTTRVTPQFWNDLFSCLMVRVPGAVAGCSVACTIAAIGYVHCMMVCISGQALGHFVNCMLVAATTCCQRVRETY